MTDKFITVVIPALNEEITVGKTIERIKEAFEKYGIKNHQILLVDASSKDRTVEIARGLGAEVQIVPKVGLGYQYSRCIEWVKGDYIIMGDSDGTYDFIEMDRFIKKLDEGYEFVMGTRLKGNIVKGAMPWPNRRIGTPLLTFFINLFFRAKISDCNSGLRAIRTDKYREMDLESPGWEYASEMVVKAKLMNLKLTEVPVSLLPDSEGRKPHLQPWKAGWENMKYIWLLATNTVFMKLGVFTWIAGLIVLLSQLFGSIKIGNFYFGTFNMFIGLVLTNISLFVVMMGVLVQNFTYLNRFKTSRISKWFQKNFNFEKGVVIFLISFGIGVILALYVLYHWLYISSTITFKEVKWIIYSIFFMTTGIQVAFFSFIFDLFRRHNKKVQY
jgi:glycosyltransferase involved in cell wall biosynthesis